MTTYCTTYAMANKIPQADKRGAQPSRRDQHSIPDDISVIAFVRKLLEQWHVCFAVLQWWHWAQVKHSSREVASLGQDDSPTLC